MTPSTVDNPLQINFLPVKTAKRDKNRDKSSKSCHSHTKQPTMTNSAIAAELFSEMCDRGPVLETHRCNKYCVSHGGEINKYYFKAAKYAFRISAGDFNARKAKYLPVFELDIWDFSEELQAELLSSSLDDSRDLVITEAVFRLFRARHKEIFYDHIQPHTLKWKLNRNKTEGQTK